MIASKPLRHKERNMHISSARSTNSFSTQPDANASQTIRRDHTTIEMEGCSQAIAEGITEHSRTLDGHTAPFRTYDVVIEMKILVTVLDGVIAEESINAPTHAETMVHTTTSLMDGVTPTNEYTAVQIDDPSLFQGSMHQHGISIALQRAQIIVDSLGEQLGKLGRNEFEGDLGRWASNLTIATLHTGLIVGTLTTIRQLLGFAIEKCMQSNAASPLTRNVIGGLSLMIGPALNILGALRDECNGTANANTRLARLATLTLSLAAFGVALAVPQALPALASFGPQMGFYTFVRDLAHLFVNITDNAPPTAGGVAARGALFGGLQFLAGTAMDTTAPNSGAGYAMSADSGPSSTDNSLAAQLRVWMERATETSMSSNPSPESRAEEILKSLTPVLGHDVLRGVYNGGIEIVDAVLGGNLMKTLQDKNKEASEVYRIKFDYARIPNASQIADGILTTAAMRTSFGQTIMASAISAGTYFASLGLPPAVTNHAVNGVVAAVAFAGFPGFVFAHAGNKPEETITV